MAGRLISLNFQSSKYPELKRVLFIASHRLDRAPNQRFRFEQYLDFLGKNGYACDVSYFIKEKDDKVLYSQGNYLAKAWIGLKSALQRLNDVVKSNQYDIIFICREAFFTGTTFFESMFSKSKAKVIYDFDDAIWHFDVSEANKKVGWLKKPGKTANIITMADLVFAGNKYLAEFAHHYNENVVIVPTTIDTDEYKPAPFRNTNPVCIGWSGSITTIRHFEMVTPIYKRLKDRFGDRISFKVIGDGSYRNEALGIQGIAWKKQDELQELSLMDIGVMPLPDDEWAKGKCGLKGLQYMAMSIATVMSPVGVNSEIIRDGENGFLPATEDEWVEKLSQLITDVELRRRLGEAGRRTVLEHYSVNAQKNNYLRYFNLLTQK